MNKIVCPNCKTAFDMDEAGYADILKQVRDEEFAHELAEREQRFAEEKASAVKLAQANLKNELQTNLAEKEAALQKDLAKREAELTELKSALDNAELQKQLSVTEAV